MSFERLFFLFFEYTAINHLLWSRRFRRFWKTLSRGHLEIALSKPILLRREAITIQESDSPLRIVYLSDVHFHPRWDEELREQLEAVLRDVPRDLLLLGGDLVEDLRSLSVFSDFVRKQAAFSPVLAVPGNHDVLVGEEVVRDAVLKGGGKWLPDEGYLWHRGNRRLGVFAPSSAVQAEIDFRILCAHDPRVFASAGNHFHLAFAGHIHGGQVVWWTHRGRMYPGGFAYEWNVLRSKSHVGTLLVSRGAVDFVPLRWRCPREILYCEVSL